MAKKLVDELEQFEAELDKSRQEEDEEDNASFDLDDSTPEEKPEEEPEESDDSGQEAESDVDDDEEAEPVEQDTEKPVPAKKLTTLPDDPDTFGEWAGKEVTEQQLVESGLLPKLVTWGHQGRHLVQKTQAELEAAKAEKSEATKLRELLEEQFKKEKEEKEVESKPRISDSDFAKAVVDEYIPGLKQLADNDGIEAEFLSDFPKVAASLEHRFQSGSNLISILAKELSDIREFVGMQKERLKEQEEEQERTSATQTFAQTVSKVADTDGDLFAPLSNPDVQKDFVRWITREDSGLQIADKDIGKITQQDVTSAWLLYVHTNPDVVPAKKSKENARMAGGGGGRGSTKSKTTQRVDPDDDLLNFAKVYKDSVNSNFDED